MIPVSMHKMTEFLKKQLTTAGAIDPRVGLLLLLLATVVIAGSALNAVSDPARQQIAVNATPSATLENGTAVQPDDSDLQPTKTLLPAEYLTNQQQTIGLTLAATAVVMVVVIGVLAAFIQHPGDD
jgi:hypothetical protein